VGELPERVDEERRTAPLLERFGVPEVELVDEVGVRRRPVWYCEPMVVGEALWGKTPEEVVLVREWPIWASAYIWCCEGGRTATPGFATGFLRRGMAPKAGAGTGWLIAVCILFGIWGGQRFLA